MWTRVVVELFDAYPDPRLYDVRDALSTNEDGLSIDRIVRHPVAKAAATCGALWRAGLGVYPPKKHVTEVLTRALPAATVTSFDFDKDAVQRILDADAAFQNGFDHGHKRDWQAAVERVWTAWRRSPVNAFFDVVIDRVSFRYGLTCHELRHAAGPERCVVRAVVSALSSCRKRVPRAAVPQTRRDERDGTWWVQNIVSDSWVEMDDDWSEDDVRYALEPLELVQYALYRDIFFLRRWRGSRVVQWLGPLEDLSRWRATLNACAGALSDLPVWVVGVDGWRDERFSIPCSVSPRMLELLPRTAYQHVAFARQVGKDHRTWIRYAPVRSHCLLAVCGGGSSMATNEASEVYEKVVRVLDDRTDLGCAADDEYVVIHPDRGDAAEPLIGAFASSDWCRFAWRTYLAYPCPVGMDARWAGTVAYVDFLQRHALSIGRPSSAAANNEERPSLTIALIDGRANALSVASVALAHAHVASLRSNTRIEVWTNEASAAYYRERCGTWATIRVSEALLGQQPFHIDVYNAFMMDGSDDGFWGSMRRDDVRHVLLIQDDGVVCKDWDDAFEGAYVSGTDYVGAPWSSDELTRCRVGNGGFSLRSVDAVLTALERAPAGSFDQRRLFWNNRNSLPEDVFYSRAISRVASVEAATKFSSEQVLDVDSYGIHKPWPYHDPLAMRTYWRTRLAAFNSPQRR